MDEAMRVTFTRVLSGEEPQQNLLNAYSKLKRGQEASDQPDPFGAEIYVICAETAYQTGHYDITRDCLRMFFQKAAAGSEYLGRAYVCQAQLCKPENAKFPDQLEKCATFILKAINFGKANHRHSYLVYNASVLYWSFARPFLKPNHRHILAKTLHQIVKALDDIEDKDLEWRGQLMISLIECYLDGGKREDATHVSTAAAAFTKGFSTQLYKRVLALQMHHKLIDHSKLLKDSKLTNEIAVYLRILKLKSQMECGEKVDLDTELDRLYRTIVSDGLDQPGTGRSTRMSQAAVIGPITQADRLPLLVDLARLCLDYERVQLAEECLASTMGTAKDATIYLEMNFLKSEITVQKLNEKKNDYTKASVETRLRAIQSLEESLRSAIRRNMHDLIQVGCVTMWNLCLPLLQKNLRKSVTGSLNLISEALENIDSLLITLRCQIHIELAKCEEENEQLDYAMNHLRKALELDDTGAYGSRIEASLHRVQLRTMLYQMPDRPEDIAALIIEQARTTKDTGKAQMKRASLVKAGLALAPDAFRLVMDGETGLLVTRGSPSNPKELAEKVKRYRTSSSKTAGHLRRLGSENEKERVKIWADLVKTARKQNIWDVTRVAAKFCLLYDDGRWEPRKRDPSAKEDMRQIPVPSASVQSPSDAYHRKQSVISPEKLEKSLEEGDRDLVSILAEVHFIYAEALVQLLQMEDVKLLERPVPAEDTSSKPKSRDFKTVRPDDTPEWKIYRLDLMFHRRALCLRKRIKYVKCEISKTAVSNYSCMKEEGKISPFNIFLTLPSEWIASLSQEVFKGFHRGAKLGAELNAPWLICNAGMYLWNYMNHILSAGKFVKLVPVLQPIYEALKVNGYAEDMVFFCDLSHALARGHMQNHLPSSRQASPVVIEKDKKGRPGKQSSTPVHMKSKTFVATNDHVALSQLRQALEILEHCINLTSGTDTKYLVPIATRHPLIKSWALCKMLTGQQMPRNLGHDDESPHSQGPMSKALFALEALTLQQRYNCDLTNCPGLFETIKMVENCKWTDRLIEIETWTRLASLASHSAFCQIVLQCGQSALNLAGDQKSVNMDKLSESMKHKYKVEHEMLYYASVLMGQNLVSLMHGRNETRIKALNHFAEACNFAKKAENYELAMCAARYYWNTCQPIILMPIERKLLINSLKAVLKCIADVWKFSSFKEIEEKTEDEDNENLTIKKSIKVARRKQKKDEKAKGRHSSSKPRSSKVSRDKSHVRIEGEDITSTLDSSEDKAESQFDADLILRASLYGVLFQSYVDLGEWKEGLQAMDEAVRVMPRTHHRLLIFKHRVIVNARLGNPVQFDMGKFKDTDESLLSSMWRRVARNSKDPREQLVAYQNAIDCLQSNETVWQLIDYLAEFGEWLFVNEFSLEDSLDQFERAIELVIPQIEAKNLLAPVSPRSSSTSAVVIEQKDTSVRGLLNDCVDIRSLDTLARLHIMCAKMQEDFSTNSQEHALTAAYCIQKLWQNAIRNGEKALRDASKPGERPCSKKESNRRDANKLERVASKSCLPQSLEQWATFTPTDKLKEQFKTDLHGFFISKTSIVKPELTIHFLEELIEILRQHGYQTLCLPICALIHYIASEILMEKFSMLLSRLQMLDLLYDLQMTNAASNLQKALVIQHLTEEDKAQSREEVQIWQEKQAQVKAEELRQKVTKSKMPLTTSESRLIEFRKNKKIIQGTSKRDVWTKISSLLIKQGQYNAARELLEEAKKSAKAFDDDRCLALIEYNSAVIAFYECNWGKVFSHVERIQFHEGPLDFWLKVILLKVDTYERSLDPCTTFHNFLDSGDDDKAISTLNSSIQFIENLSKNSRNKSAKSRYMKAVLETRLADYLLASSSGKGESKTDEIRELLENSRQTLMSLGNRREALRVIKKEIELYKKQIRSSNGSEKRSFLIKCFDLSKMAIDVSEKMAIAIKSTSESSEISNTCLPADEELANSVLQSTEIVLEILREMTTDAQRHAEVLSKKDSTTKLVEDFVSADPCYTEDEIRWNTLTTFIGEEALTLLTQIYSQSDKLPRQQAKASLYIGQCLHQIALQKFPGLKEYDNDLRGKDVSNKTSEVFSKGDQEISDPSQDEQAEHESGDEKTSEYHMTPRQLRKQEKIQQIKQMYADYTMIMTQAVEYLLQATHIALQFGFKDLIAESSYSLVRCIENRDITAATQFLALYQSAAASFSLCEITQRVTLDAQQSRVSGLTQQHNASRQNAPHSNESIGTRGLNQELLHVESEAWRRLTITRNHLDLLKDMPLPVTFVILQHSPCKSILHAAIIEKPRTGLQTGKKKEAAAPVNRSCICSTRVSNEVLLNLLNMCKEFKADVSSFLLQQSFHKQQIEKRQEMLGLIERTATVFSKECVAFEANIALEEKKLQTSFEDLLAAIEGYLGPVLCQLQDSLLQEPVADTVVILADQDLLHLPLEALPLFHHADIKSVTRDFSLQVFCHRLNQGEIPDQSDGKHEKGKTGKKDKAEVKSKSEKAMGSTNKKAKGSRELSFGKDGILLDITNLRYISDPTCELPIEDENSPTHAIAELISQLKHKAAKWIGLKGHDHVPSVAEIQKFVQESPSLIFYGFEHFLARLPPQFIAPLCLTDCHLVVLMDNMRTLKGALQQGKLDAKKSPADLKLEQPLETAMLLSLSGTPCLVLNQWQCEAASNRKRFHILLEGLCEHSYTIGQALRSSRNTASERRTQQLIHDEGDAASEKASVSVSSQGKSKHDGKGSKQQHRAHKPESARTNKVSSPGSTVQSKLENKQKLEKILKEKSERKASVDHVKILETGTEKSEDTSGTPKPYELYNTVLYGLPSFSTSCSPV